MLKIVSFIIHLLHLLQLNPKEAAIAVGIILGRHDIGKELIGICMRESKCNRIGIHERDGFYAPKMYQKALRAGWINPSECAYHAADQDLYRFGVRGAFGTSAAYTLRHLGFCAPPEILDIPFFAAYASARRMLHQCEKYGACTREARRRLWSGALRFDKRQREQQQPPKERRE